MQFRFLELVHITNSGIAVRKSGTLSAEVLARTGLLDEALRAIVTKLGTNKVADGFRAATIFFSSSSSARSALEWKVGNEATGELLDFDMDDLDDVPDQDIDAMTAALDISNAASRALAVFDLFRDNLVGAPYSAALAAAMHPWIINHVLPAAAVLKSLRPEFHVTGVPPDTLRARTIATSAAARVLQAAMHSRGADPSRFFISINIASIESVVAAECRAQALLSARLAIGTFADARHDPAQLTPCPLSAHAYVPREQRTGDYFPPCIISKSAATVLDVFSRTCTDALHALSGGSVAIGTALMSAAFECVDAYRVDVPLQHGNDIRGSLRLKAIYYNDCMMLKFACQQAVEMDAQVVAASAKSKPVLGGSEAESSSTSPSAGSVPTTRDAKQVSAGLAKAAESVMVSVRRLAEKGLMDNLNSACRNGAIGAYGTLTHIQRSSALRAAYNAMLELVEVFADIIPTEIAELAAASLCEKYLRKLCDAVLELEEIMPDACNQIDSILEDACSKVEKLMSMVNSMADVRQGAPAPDIVARLALAHRRAEAYRFIVNARMEDIVSRYREGRYGDAVDRHQVESFLIKIFEDTPLRSTFIADLDVNPDEEKEEWGEKW
jgi:hypothetical protein